MQFYANSFMQINRICISTKFYYQVYKKKLISLRLINFKNCMCILQEGVI